VHTISRRWGLAALLGLAVLLPARAGNEAEAEARAVRAIEDLKGVARRDPKIPGNPVVLVELRGDRVKDDDLKPLLALKQLYALHLYDCGITDTGLLTVGRLGTLKSLFLRCPRLTDDGLKMLSGLRVLKVLDLSGTAVKGPGFKELGVLKELKALYLRKAPVTDVGLGQIAGLSELESLFLDGTRVTDAGMKVLTRLRSLRNLDVRGTRVTDEGLVELRKSLPRLNVVR
jgi:hypothetical protein